MAFFFKFPYTNAYQLNLDWLMETVKRLEERIGEGVVESFNDRAGDVTLESEDVNALCINSVYVSDPGESVPTGDALNELFQGGVRIILLRDSEGFAKQLYTVDGTEEGAFATQFIPDISGSAVTTFNGRTGAVSLLVSDVNGLGIDITWTSDPGDTIEDLSQADFNDMYAAGIRVLIFQDGEGNPDTLYMLMLIDDTPTPQAYTPAGGGGAVASVNGQTGVVVLYGTDIYTSNALGAGTVSAGIAANAAAIGTLSSLATSDKSSAVAAINEVNTVAGNALIAAQAAQSDATAAGTAAASAQTAAIAAGTAASTAQTTANSAATTAGNAATAAAAADSHVGTLANLTTTDKTSAVAAVNELNDQKAEQASLAPVYNDATAPAGGIPANSFFYHNGEVYFTPSQISQGTTISSELKVTAGALNALFNKRLKIKIANFVRDVSSNVVIYYTDFPDTVDRTNIMFVSCEGGWFATYGYYSDRILVSVYDITGTTITRPSSGNRNVQVTYWTEG